MNLFLRGSPAPQGAEAAQGTEGRVPAELPPEVPGAEPAPRRVPRLAGRRVLRFARRHALFGGVLLVAAGVRVLAILGYPGVLVTPDSLSYVSVALRMRPYPIRPSGYAAMLWLLRPFHSLATAITIQHVMGLAIGVMGYLLLRRIGFPGWGATLAMVPVLLSAYEIQLEHFVLADTLFAFLVMLAVVLVMWRPDPPLWIYPPAGLALAAATLVRSQGLPLLIVFLACVLIRFAGWRTLAGVLVMAAAFAIPVASYAAWFDSAHGTFRLTSSNGAFLYAAVTPFADCGKIKLTPAEQPLCLNVPVSERSYTQTYIWDQNSPLRALPGGEFGRTADRLGAGFALRAIRAQPAAYLQAAWHSFSVSFLLHGNISAPDQFQREAAALQRDFRFPAAPHQPPPEYAVRRFDEYGPAGAEQRVVHPYADWVWAYQRFIVVSGPLLAVITLTGLAGVIAAWRRLGGPALLPWLTGLCLLVVPAATVDFSPRYLVCAIPPLCVAAAVGVRQIVGVATRPRAPADPKPADPKPDDPRPDDHGPDDPQAG